MKTKSTKKATAPKPAAKDMKPKTDAKGGVRFVGFPPPREGGDD